MSCKSGPATRLWLLTLLCLFALTVAACGRDEEPEPEPTAAPMAVPESGDGEADGEEVDEEPADAVALPTPTPEEEAVAKDASESEAKETTDALSDNVDETADGPHGGREGMAAYMSDEFHGQATASGLTYDKDAMMAAHKSLPFESEVVVMNPETGATVTVIIVDRLPERAESIIDVSSAAAAELEMLDAGMVWVVLEPAGE